MTQRTSWYLSTSFLSLPKYQTSLWKREDVSLEKRTSLPVDFLIDLLSFCLHTTYFIYDGTYHQQVFGTAMGSPVSAVIANLLMEDVEQRALTSSPVKPLFWKRYVDDVISAVSQKSGKSTKPFKFG